MKKAVSLIMAALMSVGLLSGCGGEQQASDVEVITVWTNQGHTKDIVVNLVDEFNNSIGKEQGIKIEYTVQGGDYKNMIDMAIQSGQAPDMFQVQGSRLPYIKNGSIIPLEDLPLSDGFMDKYDGLLRDQAEVFDGKTYAVPFDYTTIGLLYNKDMFKAAGIVDENGEATPPKTFDEMIDYAKRLTNPQEKVYGFALPMKWGGFFDYYMSMPIYASTGRTGYDYANQTYDFSFMKLAFDWLLQIKNDNSYFPGPEGLDNDPARAQFAEGRIGMMFGATWDVGVLNEQFVAKCDWDVAPIPVWDENNRYKQSGFTASFLEVGANAKNKDLNKVATVYEWFNSDEFIQKLYEECKVIPYSDRIVQNSNAPADKKGWKGFADMVAISYQNPTTPSVKLEGDTASTVYNRIWAGETGVEEGLNDLTTRYNQALEKGVADGSIDLSLYETEITGNTLD